MTHEDTKKKMVRTCFCGESGCDGNFKPAKAKEYPMKRWCKKRKKWIAGMWREL